MKRLLFLLFPLSIVAQDGIQFKDITWEAALKEAQSTNKMIFLDAYTTWCQPCKALEKYTFTDPDVGTLFNTSFINVRLDMEKYPGIELSEKYAIDLYPTILFIDGNGELIHRGCGALEAPDLISLGKAALQPEKTLRYARKAFDEGARSPETIDNYMMAMQNACKDANGIIATFFGNVAEKELAKEENWYVIREYVFDIYSREFLHLLERQDLFMETNDPDQVQDKIFDTFMMTFMEMSKSESSLFAIKSIKHLAMQNEFRDQKELLNYLDFGLGELTEDWELYADGAVGFMKPEVEDPEMILDIAWKFYLFIGDKEKLLLALNWTKYVLENSDPTPSVIDTYASLLFKIGKKEEAVKFSQQALELAQSWGEETEHYEFQLKKFKE